MSSIEYNPIDPYGNLYTGLAAAPLNITTIGNNTITGTAPLYINVSGGWTTATNSWWPTTYEPNAATLTPAIVECLFEKMVTRVKPGEKVIVCVDLDVTPTQAREVADGLADRGLDGIVLRGARAGTGFAGEPQNLTREEARVDTLARLLELWQQRPEMKLTNLLEWYRGEEMEDADFAAAVETYFQKVTDGIYKRP